MNKMDLTRRGRSQTKQSGFMLFAEFDYHQWLGLYGIQRKLARWILGNPIIAITMIRHDLEAALFAPVELLLVRTRIARA